MSTYGNSFDQTLGIMTAGTEIMVGMPSQVARGWRTIAANISAVGESSKEYVDKSGEVNITMKKQNGEIKTTYEFLTDLYKGQKGVSKAWDKLNKDQKTAIALELAGKNNQEKFLAVMNNFETALMATETAERSHGSAMRENARYLDSLEGRVQALKSAWSSFSNAMLKGDDLKGILEGLTNTLKFFTSDFGQALIKIGMGMAMFTGVTKLVQGVAGAKLFTGITKGAKGAGKALEKAGKTGGKATKTFGKFGATIGKAGGVLSKMQLAMLSPQFLAIAAAATLAGVGIYKLYKHFQKGKDTTERYNKSLQDFEETEQKYKDIVTEIADLQTKVDMGEATESEKKRLEILKEQKKEYKEQLKIKRQIMQFDFKDDVTKNAQKSKRDQIYADEMKGKRNTVKNRTAAREKADSADLSEYTELTKTTEEYAKSLQTTGKALEAVNKQKQIMANTKEGSDEWRDAAKNFELYNEQYEEANKQSNNFRKSLVDQIAEWDKVYGSAEEMPEDIRASYLEAKELEGAMGNLSNLAQNVVFDGSVGDMEWSVLTQNIQKMGETIGVAVDEAGNFNRIDLSTFQAGLEGLGFQTSDVVGILQQISETNPEATIDLNGEEVALGRIKDFDQLLEAQDGKIATSEIALDKEDAIEGIGTLENGLSLIDESEVKATVEADVKGDKEVKQLTDDVEKTPDKKNVNVKATGEVDDSVEDVTSVTNAPPLIDRTIVMRGVDEGATELVQNVNNQKVQPKTMQVGGKLSQSFTNAKSQYEKVPKTRSSTLTIGGKIAASFTSAVNKIKSVKSSLGFAKGTRNAPEGLAEVNERGWEFIRDAKTGQLRVAGGGNRTVTYLGRGDEVYTHAESKRMISDYNDIEIPQHAKGKKSKKSKGKKQDNYNKKYDAITKWYDDQVKKAEHTQEMNHLTDKWLADQKQKFRNQAQTKLDALNKKKIKGKGKLKRTRSLTQDLRFGQEESMEDALHDIATDIIDNMLSGQAGTATDLQNTLAEINRQASHLSEKEKTEYTKEAYKTHLEYNLKLFENEKRTYKDMRAQVEDYHKSGMISAKEYYDYLDDLMEQQLEKEVKSLEKRKKKNEDTYDLAKSWIDRKIESLEKENEQMDEQNELIEKQNDLEKARTQRIKVYRQGKGFVYEQDTQAIKEATSALREYKKEEESEELKSWRKVSELFDQMEASAEVANLERLVGASFGDLFGGFGTNLGDWENWLKNSLSEKYGLENLIAETDELKGYEAIQNFLQGMDDTISEEQILNSIAKNRFATGTLSAPAGFARVAENGYEIALLGKGDAVMPHGVSRNLMEWGQHSPTEFIDMQENGNITNYAFDSLVLPNVTDANSFVRELHNLPNKALQYSRGRA